jgi:hypothetical protein
MATPTPLISVDLEAVRGIVAEVLRRIRAATPAPVAAAQPAAAPASGGVALAGRVISLAMLEKLPAGVALVRIEATAVITPSARDRARDKGIVIDRAAVGGVLASAGVPFLVAHAECGGDASARTAAVVRAVPGAAHLPATGLADVVAALALHASRDAARGVLLTGKPAMATVLANRSASLRGVTARDPAALAAAAVECNANLLVVDPASFPTAALLRLSADLAAKPAGDTPAPLAARPAGCGCKGH